ncbi:MAG: hypothetical protein ACKOCH_11600 [Bacteroidota bacterium]
MVKMRLNIRMILTVGTTEKYDNEAVRIHLVKIIKQSGQLSAAKTSHLFKKEQKDPTFEPEMTITLN